MNYGLHFPVFLVERRKIFPDVGFMALTIIHSSELNRKQRVAFASFLLAVLYLPVTLLWTGVIPFHYRFVVTFCGMAVIIGYAVARKLNWSDLGFRCDTLKKSLLWNVAVSLLFLTIIYILYRAGFIANSSARFWPLFFIFYIFILSPAQEFFFRSVLFAELRKMNRGTPWTVILISSISYCFLHVIYQHPLLMAVTLLMGIVWGIIYYRYPNFWGVVLSHAILGTAAFAMGLI